MESYHGEKMAFNAEQLLKSLWPVKTKYELIRIGANEDGGYLIPDDLEGITTCFSPGVGTIASFEEQLLTMGISSHLCDGSVSQPPAGLNFASFISKFLGVVDNENTMTLESWVKTQSETGDFILQMDIEGHEFSTIIATPVEILKRFRIIAMEIHWVKSWNDPLCGEFVQAFFDKLLEHFYVVHNHPNNHSDKTMLHEIEVPEVFELTLLRKDRSEIIDYVKTLPHPLDRHNAHHRPAFNLPQSMYYKE